MDLVEEDILMHYGVKRRSGRYPWGSGDNPYQHGGDFLARVEELQRLGKTEKQIADELHLSTTDLRMQVRVAKHERRALQADRARSLREDGKTLDEIASILGYANDSSVRALLNENTAANKNKAQATAEILKKELAEKGAIDVGTGVERQLGVSTGVLQEALFILETEGYNRYGVGVPQVNDPKKRTITPVISVPEIDQREVYQNLDLVKSVGDYHSTDGGESWDKREYPASIDSSRVKILYGDEGGALKDGVIEIRRGVADLDLGDSHYAQVRILVDGTHYLKGMAMYSDDMPDGADIVFNTNKHTGTPMSSSWMRAVLSFWMERFWTRCRSMRTWTSTSLRVGMMSAALAMTHTTPRSLWNAGRLRTARSALRKSFRARRRSPFHWVS